MPGCGIAVGEPLLRRPRHQASLTARLHFARWSVGATVVHVGERADSDFVGLGLTRIGRVVQGEGVLVRDENEDVPTKLLELMRSNDHILSLTVQTMTYTGQGGGLFEKAKHVPVDDAARMLCKTLDGEITPDDFVSRPSCHPQKPRRQHQ